MTPDADEFGIPIKKKQSAGFTDEFGIPVKKKESGISSSTGGTVGSSVPQSENATNPFALGGQYNQPQKYDADKADLLNTKHENEIKEQVKAPLKRIPIKPILDNVIPKPISEIDAKEGIARQQQHKKDLETAIDNTTLKVLKQKGIVAGKGSPYYEAERKKIEEKTKPTMIGGIVVNGAEATYHKDKDGNIGLDRNLGFIEGIRKGFNAAVDGEDEANAFAEMDTKQKVEYANKQMEGKPTEYMEERGGVGELLGGATPYLVKAAAAGTLATAAAIAAPETGGLSMAGAAPVLTVLLTAPDMIKQGAKDEIMTRYMQLKQERPNIPDEELMKIAEQGEISGGIAGAAEALAFTTTLKLPILKDSKDVLSTYLKGVASSAVHLGGIMAGTTAAKIAERKIEGYNVDTDEAIDEVTTAFTENATAGAILNGLISGAHTLPKVIKSAFKFSLKDTPTSEIKTALDANVQAGRIPPEVAEQTIADIEGYKVALAKTADGLKPETQASVAGLIQARDNVAAEMATKDPTQRAVYEQKIEAYNKQIEKITKTNDPLKYEVDEVTGNTIDKVAPKGEPIELSTETKKEGVTTPTESKNNDAIPPTDVVVDKIVDKIIAKKEKLTDEELRFVQDNKKEIDIAVGKKVMANNKTAKPKEVNQAQVEDNTTQGLLNKYNEDTNYNIYDLVNDIEKSGDAKLKDAVAKYREEQAYDNETSGRNDMTAAEDNFVKAVEQSLSKEQPSKGADVVVDKGSGVGGDVESIAKSLADAANKKVVRFLPDDKVILKTKDGKEVEVSFRGYNGSSETKAVIFGSRGSGIGQMEVDVSQLRKKTSSDKLSTDERNKLMGKIDLEKTKYWGKGLGDVSDAELIELSTKHPKWDKLSQSEKQAHRDFETAITPIKRRIESDWGSDAPKNIVDEIKKEHAEALSNIIGNEKYAPQIAEAYLKAKANGTNPELVKAVEKLLPTQEGKVEQPSNKQEGVEPNQKPKNEEAKVTEDTKSTTETVSEQQVVDEVAQSTGGKKEPPKEPTEPVGGKGDKDRLNDKGILNHLESAKNVPDAAKEGFREKGLKYETKSQKEAEDVAKSVIDQYGIEDAVLLAEAQKFDGDVNSLIYAESLNRLAKLEDTAKTPEEKLAFVKQFAEVGIKYDEAARKGGRFSSAINYFYKKSPLGIQMIENAKRKEQFEQWAKPKEKSWKEFFDEMVKEPEFDALVKEQVKEGMKKERAEARAERIKKVDDFFDKAKDQFKGGAAYSTIIPPKVITTALEGMKQAYHAGEKVAKIIEDAVDYISEQLGNASWDKDKFRKEWEEKLKDKPDKKKLTDEEVKAKILDRFRNKLKGLSDKQKEDVVRKSFQKIVESGGLDYADFRKIIAEVTGRNEMTDAEAAKLKELVAETNKVDDAATKARTERTPESLKAYREAEVKAGTAQRELNTLLYNRPNVMKRLTSMLQLNTLGLAALVNNPVYNVINQLGIRVPVGVIKTGIDRTIQGIGKLFGKDIQPETDVLSLKVQKEFFNYSISYVVCFLCCFCIT